MPVQIDLVRHGETESNRAGRWQGQGDSPLTSVGVGQARRLGERLAGTRYDLVVSSDLGRALATAAAVTPRAEPDAAWREADIGDWEGLTTAEVMAAFPDEIGSWATDASVRLGGGESYGEMVDRVTSAFDKLLARLDDGARALVVTHGGVIGSLLAQILGYRRTPGNRPLARLANTAISTVVADDGTRQIASFNDVHHLDGELRDPAADGALLHLIRHGETVANREGRWQGVTDGDLSGAGLHQAERLARWHDGVAAVYSSPLRRARETAGPMARRHEVEHRIVPGLAEMAFGDWEDHTPEAIAARWPDDWARIYVGGEDAPRGGSGETYAGVAARMGEAIAGIAANHPEGRVAVVSHGGAIRAYVTSLIGVGFQQRHRLAEPRNTAVSRLAVGNGRPPMLVDYNLVPHLDD